MDKTIIKMTLKTIAEQLKVQNLTPGLALNNQVTACYTSDLLSDVVGNASPGMLWVTIQTHMNVIAVASLKDLSAVIIANGNKVEEKVLQKALEEKIPVFSTPLSTFEISGKIYNLIHKNA